MEGEEQVASQASEAEAYAEPDYTDGTWYVLLWTADYIKRPVAVQLPSDEPQ